MMIKNSIQTSLFILSNKTIISIENFFPRSSSKSHEEATVDLVQSLIECQQVIQLIFDNRFNEALKKN